MNQKVTFFLELIENRIKNERIKKTPFNLYKPILYTLENGGKRIRPLLFLLTIDALGNKKDIDKFIDCALILEFFHNSTLIHDDIMDEAETRRNKATVYKKWGRDIAILAGDVLLLTAFKFFHKIPKNILCKILNDFIDVTIKVCEGQQLDLDYQKIKSIKIKQYYKMIRLKTAELLAFSLKFAGLLLNKELSTIKTLYKIGINLGLAFQIQDDYLDVYGNEEKFGKKIGNDIICAKKNFLYVKALSCLNEKDKFEFIKLYHDNDPSKVSKIVSIYNNINLNQLVIQELSFLKQKILKDFEILSKKYNVITLKEFCLSLMDRDK